jgi:DNA topoisomerase I
VARLRRADCSGPGIGRRRRGKGFEYLDNGERVTDPETLERIRALAIPPAWEEVWICPHPNGHLQATGTDAAGRKQYRYHDRWRQRRDQEKFEEMRDFARALPKLRKRVQADLALEGMPRERALACAARLMDRGFFRIGSEDYAEENETYGVATIRRDHVTVEGDQVSFDYDAKGGQKRELAIPDPALAAVVRQLLRRRGGGEELLAYKDGRRWVDLKSTDINAYVKEATGGDFSAKDFRTWNGTVHAAKALAASAEAIKGSKTARKRAMTRAIKEVAGHLGNTPAVARSSYIDPRLFDRFDSGRTIAGAADAFADDGSPEVEQAVLDLLDGDYSSDAIEKGGVGVPKDR